MRIKTIQSTIFIVIAYICIYKCPYIHAISHIKAVSVFRNDEVAYHKYSAVLAAAEPFRMQLHSDIQHAMSPLAYCLRQLKGSFAKPLSDLRSDNAEIDAAYQRYENRVDDIVRSYGLNVDAFNTLSKKISSESMLKQRVLLQSYYYRIAADLESNIRKELPVLPHISTSRSMMTLSPTASDHHHSTASSKSSSSESQLTRFCKTLRTIEQERLKQRDELQSQLGVSTLPPHMCDANIYPTMSKEIQHACRAFQHSAAQIITHHHLSHDDFAAMQAKLQAPAPYGWGSSLLFKMRVGWELARLERDAKGRE